LEHVVANTALAKEWSRAQAILWLTEGQSAEEVASLLGVNCQTSYD
jgi:transposase